MRKGHSLQNGIKSNLDQVGAMTLNTPSSVLQGEVDSNPNSQSPSSPKRVPKSGHTAVAQATESAPSGSNGTAATGSLSPSLGLKNKDPEMGLSKSSPRKDATGNLSPSPGLNYITTDHEMGLNKSSKQKSPTLKQRLSSISNSLRSKVTQVPTVDTDPISSISDQPKHTSEPKDIETQSVISAGELSNASSVLSHDPTTLQGLFTEPSSRTRSDSDLLRLDTPKPPEKDVITRTKEPPKNLSIPEKLESENVISLNNLHFSDSNSSDTPSNNSPDADNVENKSQRKPSLSSDNSLAIIQSFDEDKPAQDSNNLTPPRDLVAVKSRSDTALNLLTPLSAVPVDQRRKSTNELVSASPRRDSAWTAEVLSIEIQVDYVMDPEELWGSQLHKPKHYDQDENENVQTIIVPLPPPRDNDKMSQNPTEDVEKGQLPSPSDEKREVGVVLPMVAGSGDDDSDKDNRDDKRSDEDPVEDEAPPEKTDPPDNPRHSGDSAELNLPPREHWENRFQFLLSTIGYAVDLSNVWRFPFLCYKNGGGAFLIPYFTTLIFGAMPVFFMEMCLGQFHRCGPTAVWEKMSPMFKGIGMASCFMAYLVAFYYNIIIGWSFFYLFSSFTDTLPWTSCFNAFNSLDCWQIDWDTNATATNISGLADSGAISYDSSTRPLNRTYNTSISISSTMEFFERGMLELHQSEGLDDLGEVRWQLALCTFLTFTVLYFCLWKGVKSTGKVVYVTATLPYVIMTILLVRGVMLPGAEDGILYFLSPKIESLRKPKVWIDAAVQIFFSVGSGFGTHIAYASYNKFHNDCKRDCMITVIVNSFTSLFSGIVIFSYLGYMSLKTHKDIDKVATEGPGLVFIVYPEAIATLPGSVGWSIIFFFMLLALGLDSAFGGLESPLTGIRDELSELMKYRYFREALTLVIIISAFVFSIPCLTQGGMYVFTILDTFAAGTSIVFIVLCEVVAVSWFYGMPQFCTDVEKMTGEKPSLFWRICWKFICPLLLIIIVISSIISYSPLTYGTSTGSYSYPFYANVVGWCIACSSMLMVPGYIIYKLIRLKGSCKERLALGISPESEHEEIKETRVVKRFQKEHWLSL